MAPPNLKDPSLFKQGVCYVNGEWVKARSGKTFEVTGTVARASALLFPLRSLTAP